MRNQTSTLFLTLVVLFSGIGVFILVLIPNPVEASNQDVTVSNSDLSNGCLTTIDVNLTKNLAKNDDLIVDYDYGEIRREGVIMNVYYSNILGRSQWTDFPSPSNIYLMPNSVLLPISRWIKDGMQTDGMWWVRVVLLRNGNC